METSKTATSDSNAEKKVDSVIRIILICLLIGWCCYIASPFIYMMIWGSIVAISVFPLYSKFLKLFRGSKAVSAIAISLILLSIIIIPSWLLTESIFAGLDHTRARYNQGQPLIPPPGENVQHWPSIAKPVIDFWQLASDNIQEAILQHKGEFEKLGKWSIASLSAFGAGILQFLISIIVGGMFLYFAEPLSKSMLKILKKITPSKGEGVASLIVNTILAVVKGILGVAAIQAAMAGTAFFIVGIPYAGLWTILCLMLSVVQIGSWPVLLSLSIYMFSTHDVLPSILFAAWMAIVATTDNVLTPVLMGRGSSVPMLVLFIGAFGGFMAIGFLGLFLGAVVFSIGYKLFDYWLNTEPQH